MSERGGSLSLPGAPSQMPNLPENFSPIIFEEFAGLNTKPLRPGIQPPEMSWCDGWMPIGPNNARTLYGTGASIYSIQHTWFGFGNISSQDYCFVVNVDGSISQIKHHDIRRDFGGASRDDRQSGEFHGVQPVGQRIHRLRQGPA